MPAPLTMSLETLLSFGWRYSKDFALSSFSLLHKKTVTKGKILWWAPNPDSLQCFPFWVGAASPCTRCRRRNCSELSPKATRSCSCRRTNCWRAEFCRARCCGAPRTLTSGIRYRLGGCWGGKQGPRRTTHGSWRSVRTRIRTWAHFLGIPSWTRCRLRICTVSLFWGFSAFLILSYTFS